MIKGETKSGFKFSIDENNLDNYELLEMFSEVDKNPLLIPKILNVILGNEQTIKLKDHIRDENGIVKTTLLQEEIIDILSVKEVKN